MNNYSIWKKGIKNESYSKLNKDIEVDVLIIGGGITGVSTLYYLKDSNLKIALVEQNRIGYGVTGNSTGKLNYLQDSLCNKIRKSYVMFENFNSEIFVCERKSYFLINKLFYVE